MGQDSIASKKLISTSVVAVLFYYGTEFKPSQSQLGLQVPVLRESLLKGKDWRALAKQQKQQQFGAASKTLAREQLQSMMQSLELLCQIEEQQGRQQNQQHHPAAAVNKRGSNGSRKSLLDTGGAEEAEVLQETVHVVCSRQVRDMYPSGQHSEGSQPKCRCAICKNLYTRVAWLVACGFYGGYHPWILTQLYVTSHPCRPNIGHLMASCSLHQPVCANLLCASNS